MGKKSKYNKMSTYEFLGSEWQADSGLMKQDCVCSRIGIILAKNGVSYKDAAKALGKKESYVRKILSGSKKLSICDAHHLLAMAGYDLNINIKEYS